MQSDFFESDTLLVSTPTYGGCNLDLPNHLPIQAPAFLSTRNHLQTLQAVLAIILTWRVHK